MLMRPLQTLPSANRVTLGSELTHALDVVSAVQPRQIVWARAAAATFARRYGFRMPQPSCDPYASSASALFWKNEASVFIREMKPVFDRRIENIAFSPRVSRLYLEQGLIQADLTSVSAAGLLDLDIANGLFSRVDKDTVRLLELNSSLWSVNPWLSRRWVTCKVAVDIGVFGALLAFTGSLATAAVVATTFAVTLEFTSLAAGRVLERRSEQRTTARIEELMKVQEHVRSQALLLSAIRHKITSSQSVVGPRTTDIFA